MNSHKYDHQNLMSTTKKPFHRRNHTAFESRKHLYQNQATTQNQISPVKQNKPISYRLSWLQRRKDPNLKSQFDIGFLKTKKSKREILFGTQVCPSLKLIQKNPTSQNKVPKFIKERQLRKSDETLNKNITITPHKAHSPFDQFYIPINFESAHQNWLVNLKQQNSFEFDNCESFGSPATQKQSCKNRKQSEEKNQVKAQVKQINEKYQNGLKSTDSTIKSINDCRSEENIFLPNLKEMEQLEISQEFRQLFSSRRIQTEMDFQAMDEELVKEFQSLLN